MSNLLQNIEQNMVGLSTQTAANMRKAIAPMAENLVEMEKNCNVIVNEMACLVNALNQFDTVDEKDKERLAAPFIVKLKETIEAAKQLRISYQKVRISSEKVKTQEKKTYLLAGNAIQGMFNIIKNETIPKENTLREIENYEKNQAQKKREKLAEERKSALNALAIEMDRQISEMPSDEELGSMNETVWNAYFSGTKNDLLEILQEEKAERARQEEVAQKERERVAQMDKDLKAERERNAKLEAEREKEQEKREALDRQLAEQSAKIEKEKQTKLAEEAKIAEEKRQLSLAPDKEKVNRYILEMWETLKHLPSSFDFEDETIAGHVADATIAIHKAVDHLKEITK